MIVRRITDFSFDDVKPPEARGPAHSGRDADGEGEELSTEKSRLGLGEIYASDYLQSSGQSDGGKSKAQSEAHEEVKGLFHKVCRSLDALSHFHYTPKPVVAEAAVHSVAVPTLSLEEVTPGGFTGSATAGVGGSALAPEEVRSKKRGRAAALVADAEHTSDDRKRLRQAGKATRRKGRQEATLQQRTLSLTGEASTAYESQKTDAILRSDRRVTAGTASGDTTSYSKSNQFFEKLQTQAQADIARGGKAERRESKSGGNAKGSSAYKS